MGRPLHVHASILLLYILSHLMSIIGKLKPWNNSIPYEILSLDLAPRLRIDSNAIKTASSDFGKIIQKIPAAVLHPSSITDIINLVKFSYNCSKPFGISARGHGHSIRGQAMAKNGVVIDMNSLNNNTKKGDRIRVSSNLLRGRYNYVDVGGEQLWIDVLRATLEHGVAPVSWTDYLYLSVGGTLSNGGISGQTFRYGPQITNVYEMDVVTGKGELVTCSKQVNPELYFAVLGGLGQFGIITRARIPLKKAPTRVKWIRMLYDDFTTFTKDQEHLISINNNNGVDYVEEVVKYYDHLVPDPVDEEIQRVLKGLNYIAGFKFKKDVSFMEFLNRVRSGELKLESKGEWDVPHPWLNIFVPKSRIMDFNAAVFVDIILKHNKTTGPILVYPTSRNKWDDRMSAIIPDEDTFYCVGFLHSSRDNEWEDLDNQNNEILEYCNKFGIKIKQYLPHYKTKEEWMNHFGSKWKLFQERKAQFDPRMILSPGQSIFNSD